MATPVSGIPARDVHDSGVRDSVPGRTAWLVGAVLAGVLMLCEPALLVPWLFSHVAPHTRLQFHWGLWAMVELLSVFLVLDAVIRTALSLATLRVAALRAPRTWAWARRVLELVAMVGVYAFVLEPFASAVAAALVAWVLVLVTEPLLDRDDNPGEPAAS